jgi:hypothetical protein
MVTSREVSERKKGGKRGGGESSDELGSRESHLFIGFGSTVIFALLNSGVFFAKNLSRLSARLRGGRVVPCYFLSLTQKKKKDRLPPVLHSSPLSFQLGTSAIAAQFNGQPVPRDLARGDCYLLRCLAIHCPV